MKSNHSAFPQAIPTSDGGVEYRYGLTKREYFAAQIYGRIHGDNDTHGESARVAVEAADALIAALSTPTAPGEQA